MAFELGPYIQAATFCSEVIEGKDGVLSLIRLMDIKNLSEYHNRCFAAPELLAKPF